MMEHLQIFLDFKSRGTCRITPKQVRFFEWKLKEAIKAHPAQMSEAVAARMAGQYNSIVHTFYFGTDDPHTSQNYLTVDIDKLAFTMNIFIVKAV